MGTKTRTSKFGSKGANLRPMTFAESLLSGRALERNVQEYTPKLKPRPKPRFGTKGTLDGQQNYEMLMSGHKEGWKFWR